MNIDNVADERLQRKFARDAHVPSPSGQPRAARHARPGHIPTPTSGTRTRLPVSVRDAANAKHRDFHSSVEAVFRKTKKMKTDQDDGKDAKTEAANTEEIGKKAKKSKKDKHKSGGVHGIKSSKASSFVRKLNLGKYMSSPSGARRSEPVRSVSTEFESDTSDRQSSASSSLTPTSVKRHTPEGDDGAVAQISVSELSIADTDDIGSRSTLSEEGVSSGLTDTQVNTQPSSVSESNQRLHEPVSAKPYAISTWKDIKPTKLQKNTAAETRDEPVRKRIAWMKQLSEDKEGPMEKNTVDNLDQITVRRHSSGDENSSKRSRADPVATSKAQEIGPDEALKESSTSHSSLPGVEEDRTESAEETEQSSAAASSTPGMPAFGDLIMDSDNNERKETPVKPVTLHSKFRQALRDIQVYLSDGQSNLTPPSLERKEHLYKILVIGELGTGKTSIIKRYVHQFFSQHYRATIGVDFALKVLNWDANTIIRLQLWDIAGQERFGNMTRVYYKDAVGAFIVFDVTRVSTFDAVVKWKQDLDSKVQLSDGSPIPCVLLGNKCDQQKEGIVNTPTRMEDFCREKGFSGWFETSAKENINIEEAAKFLVNKILVNDKLLHNSEANKDNERIAIDGKGLNGQKTSAGSKSCSC